MGIPPRSARGIVAVLAFVIVVALAAQEPTAQDPVSSAAADASPHGVLSLACSDCHTTDDWAPLADPRVFDHGEVTDFPLIAGHRDVDCQACHGDLRFAWVASACADCHEDPHQGELGFACADCHDPRGWFEARQTVRRRHALSLFPLTGAHAGLDCAACHGGTAPFEFSLAPTDCFGCHAADFGGARNPNHLVAGFSTTCEDCHGTDAFRPGRFREHDIVSFPIFSGVHEGVWVGCSDCHVSPTTFAIFSCFACHPRSQTDPIHANVAGYRYLSTACLACHPDGRGR